MNCDVVTAHNTIKSVLGKPDQYICIDVTPSPNMQFGGTKEPAAVVSLSQSSSDLFTRLEP